MIKTIAVEDDGVPQGSVLVGLFHLINSNDFLSCHEEGEAIVYVDDDSGTVHTAAHSTRSRKFSSLAC